MVPHAELPGFFRLQARSCAGAPAYRELFESLARLAERDRDAFAALHEAWRERSFATFYGATLLLAASLHRAHLEGDPVVRPLSGLFERGAEPALDAKLAAILRAPSARMAELWRTGSVQTNEVTRSVAWRIVADLVAGPIVLAELGCSAGLNLVPDDLGLTWRGWRPRRAPQVVAALGIDRSPLDVRREEDRLLLRACLWPGQAERRARLDLAISKLVDNSNIQLERGVLPAAVERLEPFARAHPGALLLVFNTTFSAYLDDPAYCELQERIAALLARQRGVWVEFETPRDRPEQADTVELAVWRLESGALRRRVIAETEPHPREVRLVPGALEELARALR